MVSKTHGIEILAILITSVVLGYIGVVAGIGLVAVDTPPPGSLHVTVIGRQYYWAFQYANGSSITWPTGASISYPKGTTVQFQNGTVFTYSNATSVTFPNQMTITYPNGLTTQATLYAKVGEVVDLDVISGDVAHSLFIPELGVHIDAIPGHDNHYWFRADAPGRYTIECTQFCGTEHYTMTAELIVTA